MNKGKFSALLPIIVFLVLFIGVGVVTGDFYVMPAVVGFLIALIFAFLQNPKQKFEEKLSILARGAGDENIMIMVVIFLMAGAFHRIGFLRRIRSIFTRFELPWT